MIGELDVETELPALDANVAARRPPLLGYALAALIVATTIAVDPAGLVPTGPMRWTAITVTTGLALCALVLRPVAIPRLMTTLWVALIVVLLLATINAVDPLSAWIGTPDRRLGLLTWLTFPALLLAGYACTARAATRIVLRAGAFSGAVLGIWSAAELLDHSPLGLHFADARAGGPFGQPAYLGAACLLVGPLGLVTALDPSETRAWRRAGALGATGALVALLASQTRAAWVGAVVAAVVLAIALQRRRPGRDRRKQALVAVVALVGMVLVLGVTTPLGARAASTFDLHHGTSAGRLDEWRIAVRTVTDHPVLGVGPEGYRTVFPREVDESYIRRYGVAVFPDRAHNGVLDVTIAGGLLAGLLYAALLVLVLRHAWRGMNAPDPVAIALGAAALAYVVQQQFLFPLAELDPIFWVLVGMLVVRTSGGVRRATSRGRWLVIPLTIATAAAMVFGAREVLADRALKRAANTADAAAALREADRATRLRPDSIRTWYVAARIAQRGQALTDVDAALARAVHGLDRSPDDPALRVLYGELLVERAARSRLADDIATARRGLRRLVAGAPHDPRLRKALVTAQSLHEIGKP
jgi:O-antigen ligase